MDGMCWTGELEDTLASPSESMPDHVLPHIMALILCTHSCSRFVGGCGFWSSHISTSNPPVQCDVVGTQQTIMRFHINSGPYRRVPPGLSRHLNLDFTMPTMCSANSHVWMCAQLYLILPPALRFCSGISRYGRRGPQNHLCGVVCQWEQCCAGTHRCHGRISGWQLHKPFESSPITHHMNIDGVTVVVVLVYMPC